MSTLEVRGGSDGGGEECAQRTEIWSGVGVGEELELLRERFSGFMMVGTREGEGVSGERGGEII